MIGRFTASVSSPSIQNIFLQWESNINGGDLGVLKGPDLKITDRNLELESLTAKQDHHWPSEVLHFCTACPLWKCVCGGSCGSCCDSLPLAHGGKTLSNYFCWTKNASICISSCTFHWVLSETRSLHLVQYNYACAYAHGGWWWEMCVLQCLYEDMLLFNCRNFMRAPAPIAPWFLCHRLHPLCTPLLLY